MSAAVDIWSPQARVDRVRAALERWLEPNHADELARNYVMGVGDETDVLRLVRIAGDMIHRRHGSADYEWPRIEVGQFGPMCVAMAFAVVGQ